MWNHRNKTLHITYNSLHKDKQKAVDSAICSKFMIGLNGLSNNIIWFFRGSINRILNSSTNYKLQ